MNEQITLSSDLILSQSRIIINQGITRGRQAVTQNSNSGDTPDTMILALALLLTIHLTADSQSLSTSSLAALASMVVSHTMIMRRAGVAWHADKLTGQLKLCAHRVVRVAQAPVGSNSVWMRVRL
jgi:hypothetical protein